MSTDASAAGSVRPDSTRPEHLRLDTGFRPTRHGFPFANTWRDTIFGVIASRGRCGGMVFAALDYFDAGEPIEGAGRPADLPAHDSPIARLIWRRQLASIANQLGGNLWRFALLTYLPSGAPRGIAATTQRELAPLLEMLAAGRPAPLGMVSALSVRHLARNHQVLAYGAEIGESGVLIRIYDPNFPRRDDIMLEVLFGGGPVIERAGSRRISWRGFFVERYRPMAEARFDAEEPLASRAPDTRLVWGAVGLGALVWLAAWLVRRRL